jgi:glycerophosphoryl diester phosphodiesterase
MLRTLDNLLAPAPAPDRTAWLGKCDYAHRGLHGGGVPENSRAAFAAALDAGMGIECDVQETRDGRAVVFHDFTAGRLIEGGEAIRDLSIGELTQRALIGGNGECVPTLCDLTALVAGRAPLLIEIKTKRERRVSRLCLAVRRALEGYRGPVAVMGFDPRVGAWFRRHAPQIVRGLVVTEEDARSVRGGWARHGAVWTAKPDFLAYDVRDLPSTFAAAQRARGLKVLTWTVKTPALRETARAHADAAIAEGAGVE